MRKLVYFTIGFAAACGLLTYVGSPVFRLVCMAVLTAACAVLGADGRAIAKAAAVVLGCCAGVFWVSQYDALYLQTALQMDGITQNVEIRVTNHGEQTDHGTVFDGCLTLDGKPYQVRVSLSEMASVAPGDYLYGPFRFRVTAPGGGSESLYHQAKGIFLLAYQADTVRIEDYAPTRRDLPARIRYKVKTILKAAFPEDTQPFAKALLIGDTSDLDYATDTDFKVSGIRHVIAVSGLHVSILFALLSAVTFRKRWMTALVGFPVLFLFAAVAGFTPSVSRACLMSSLMLLAMLVNKEYDGPTALAFAVLVILAVNPLSVTSVSFQLSVSSVAGIYLFDPGIRKWLTALFGEWKGKKIKSFFVKWFCASVSITLSAMTLTTPLCAYYFGTVSLIGPVTNLLALWVVSFIFYGIMGVCALYLFLPAGAALLAKLISIPIRYVLLVARIMADVPMAAVYTTSVYIVIWLVFVYILLLIFLISQNRRPVTLFCCSCLGLCLALVAGWTEPVLDEVRFTVLDVGQGQCLLLQTEGKTCMVDCGGDSDARAADIAAQTLLSQGINRLDCLILTHLDRDHAAGAENLLTRMAADLLILPPVHTDLGENSSGEVVYAAEDLQLTLGKTEIQIFTPKFPGDSNEMSLCILFDTEKCDILVTGDRSGFGERSLLRNADIPDVDILVAGHHGSKNSTCDALLEAVRPEIVCISAGQDNVYGHPAPELLQRLKARNCTVYRTDLQGDLIFRR